MISTSAFCFVPTFDDHHTRLKAAPAGSAGEALATATARGSLRSLFGCSPRQVNRLCKGDWVPPTASLGTASGKHGANRTGFSFPFFSKRLKQLAAPEPGQPAPRGCPPGTRGRRREGSCPGGGPAALRAPARPTALHRAPPRLTAPGAGVPRRFRAAEREAAGLAERPAEVLVHHGADVPLEVGEEDAAGADVLGLGGSLLLGAAVFLLDVGRGVAGEGAAGAGAAAALRGFLHFGVKGEFLEESRGGGDGKEGRKENRAGYAAQQGALSLSAAAGMQCQTSSCELSERMQKSGPRLPTVPPAAPSTPQQHFCPTLRRQRRGFKLAWGPETQRCRTGWSKVASLPDRGITQAGPQHEVQHKKALCRPAPGGTAAAKGLRYGGTKRGPRAGGGRAIRDGECRSVPGSQNLAQRVSCNSQRRGGGRQKQTNKQNPNHTHKKPPTKQNQTTGSLKHVSGEKKKYFPGQQEVPGISYKIVLFLLDPALWENRSLLDISHFLFISASVSAAAGSFLEKSNGDAEPGLGRCGQRPGAGPGGSTERTLEVLGQKTRDI